MSGIFIQSVAYLTVVYSFFLASFLLGSFACFGLKMRYNSNVALFCGLLYLASFAIASYSIIRLYLSQSNILVTTSNFLASLNVGILVWGATLLKIRKALPHPKLGLLIASLFILIAVLTLTWFWQLFLYWGVEFWFMLFGWLYAFCSLNTALILYKLKKRIVS